MEGQEHGAVNEQGTSFLCGSHKVLQLAIVTEPHRDRDGITQVIPGTRQRIVRLKGSSRVSEMPNVVMNSPSLFEHCEEKRKNIVRLIVCPRCKAMDRPERVIDRDIE